MQNCYLNTIKFISRTVILQLQLFFNDEIVLNSIKLIISFCTIVAEDKQFMSLNYNNFLDEFTHCPSFCERTEEASCSAGEREWYFFCRRGRKYKNSVRPNRVTNSGFWKATGIDKPIYSVGKLHYCIGLKKSLVYYRGSAGKGTKTDWMMHEFRLPASENTANLTNPDDCNIHEAVRFIIHSCIFYY
jgi:hypothetical protein